MHRGYVPQWRKELDSAVFTLPPLHYKVWRWILASVDWQTGVLTATSTHIGDRVAYMENNREYIPARKTIRTILYRLQDEEMIQIEVQGACNAKFYHVTVCNWATYQIQNQELVTPEKRQGNANDPIFKNSKELKEDKRSTPPPAAPPAARDLDDDTSYEAECYAGWCEIEPNADDADYPAAFFQSLVKPFGEQLPVLILHRFIATKGTIDDLEQPDKWTAYFWAMCERNHQNANQENVNNGQHMGTNSRELSFEDIWPELVNKDQGVE